MGGSMGCGPIETLAEELSAALPGDAEVSVMCGTNKKLAASLEEKALPHVRVVRFTREMPRWLAAADLFLTKPGGLSISESGTAGTPMLFLDTVGGCESHNREFFVSHGWAECAGTAEEMAARCAALIGDRETLAARADTLRRTFPRDAAEHLVNTLCTRAPQSSESTGADSVPARYPDILEGKNAHAITTD
jgi:processive 1,2-diacylglycerol beta-glucosyltransferase